MNSLQSRLLLKILSLCCLSLSFKAWSFSILFMTDQASLAKAQDFAQWIKTVRPFNKFHIDMKVEFHPKEKLQCKAGVPSRVVDCDRYYVLGKMLQGGHDRAVVISETDGWGGAPGQLVFLSTRASRNIFLHELMHTFGFADEYEFKQGEDKFHCKKSYIQDSVNFVLIPNEILGPYASSTAALESVRQLVPWIDNISSSQPMLHEVEGQIMLGGRALPEDAPHSYFVGLYPGKTCYFPDAVAFKAYFHKTIMEDVSAPVPLLYEQILEQKLLEEEAEKLP